jgi:peptidoglycan/xylan/chitin deacetylase (PgdA/CDA1 family)
MVVGDVGKAGSRQVIRSFGDHCISVAARGIAAAGSTLGGARLSILIFHRVLAEPDSLFPGEIDLARFERTMALVGHTFHVLPLADAVHRLANHSLPVRALSITFDDGYADNHDLAVPVLARLGLPATVFISNAFLDGGRMWNDTVIECLRRTTREQIALGELGLPPMPTATGLQRRMAIDQILPLIKYRKPKEREHLLQKLQAACGAPSLPINLMMSHKQVQALPAAGIDVGAHTVHHPILCTIDDDEAATEMANSRAALETLIDRPVTLFAYPNGRPGTDYDQRHANLARALGFVAAVSTATGVNRPGDDLFHLKRFSPWDRGARRWLARLTAHHMRS